MIEEATAVLTRDISDLPRVRCFSCSCVFSFPVCTNLFALVEQEVFDQTAKRFCHAKHIFCANSWTLWKQHASNGPRTSYASRIRIAKGFLGRRIEPCLGSSFFCWRPPFYWGVLLAATSACARSDSVWFSVTQEFNRAKPLSEVTHPIASLLAF